MYSIYFPLPLPPPPPALNLVYLFILISQATIRPLKRKTATW